MEKGKSTSLLPLGTVVDWLVLLLLWSGAIFLVRPIGDFPLNDDWSYGLTVKRLVEGGGYHPCGWTYMTLITQALWGALFCIPQGFSFTALRFSTLAAGFVGLLALYTLIRQVGGSRSMALTSALTLACNPIYFALSNTFMTDVPFTALALLTALFFARYLQHESERDLWLGAACAVAATLCRQLGLCLPLALAATLVLKHGFQIRWLARAAGPLLLSVLVFVAFQHWLEVSGRLPNLYGHKADRLAAALAHPVRIPLNVSYFGWSMLMYLGCFLLPVLLLTGFPKPAALELRWTKLGAGLAVSLFCVASVVRFLVLPTLMPVHNNILIPQGIGPATLRDTLNLHLANLPALPPAFWLLVTAASLAGAAFLVFRITSAVVGFFPSGRFDRSHPDTVLGTFFLLCVGVYLLPFLASGFFDRYLLPVMALLMPFLAASLRGAGVPSLRAKTLAAGLLLAGSGVFALAGTRDYLEWNRTRWRAMDELLAKKQVEPKNLDGGFEFNGWYKYDTFTMTNWWVVDDTYVISFGQIAGYEPITRYTYKRWLPPREGTIFVLKRKTQD
jgi:hypothetical protein